MVSLVPGSLFLTVCLTLLPFIVLWFLCKISNNDKTFTDYIPKVVLFMVVLICLLFYLCT